MMMMKMMMEEEEEEFDYELCHLSCQGLHY